MVVEQRDSSGRFVKGNDMEFQPGESGNLKGRPKDPIRELLKEKDNQKVADKLYQMAINGNLNAISEYLDRREGKVTLPIGVDEGAEKALAALAFVELCRLQDGSQKLIEEGSQDVTEQEGSQGIHEEVQS